MPRCTCAQCTLCLSVTTTLAGIPIACINSCNGASCVTFVVGAGCTALNLRRATEEDDYQYGQERYTPFITSTYRNTGPRTPRLVTAQPSGVRAPREEPGRRTGAREAESGASLLKAITESPRVLPEALDGYVLNTEGGSTEDKNQPAVTETGSLQCPISLTPIQDPIVIIRTKDGTHYKYFYDRDAITKWLAAGKTTNPLTMEDLSQDHTIRAATPDDVTAWSPAQHRNLVDQTTRGQHREQPPDQEQTTQHSMQTPLLERGVAPPDAALQPPPGCGCSVM